MSTEDKSYTKLLNLHYNQCLDLWF